MSENDSKTEIVAAIQDLTRVTIALSGVFASKADAVRRLSELGIPPVRIAGLLAIPVKSVHAELAKARYRGGKVRGSDRK